MESCGIVFLYEEVWATGVELWGRYSGNEATVYVVGISFLSKLPGIMALQDMGILDSSC